MATAARLRIADSGSEKTTLSVPAPAYWLSATFAGVSAIAAALTLFAPGVLRGVPVMNGSARGTALVVLAVGLPILVVSMSRVSLGAFRPVIAWLGAAGFLQYNAVMFLIATPFNSVFPLYVAMFALGFWTLVVLLRSIDVESFRARFRSDLTAKLLAAYVGSVAVLNALAWLAGVIPGLFSDSPAFLKGTGLTTMPTYVQDLAFWLPLMAVSAVLLWRRQAWGYLLVGGLLVQLFIESISVAVDQWMGSTADPASTVASASAAPIFGAVAAIGLVPLIFYFRSLKKN